jgi:hypothetical protein
LYKKQGQQYRKLPERLNVGVKAKDDPQERSREQIKGKDEVAELRFHLQFDLASRAFCTTVEGRRKLSRGGDG